MRTELQGTWLRERLEEDGVVLPPVMVDFEKFTIEGERFAFWQNSFGALFSCGGQIQFDVGKVGDRIILETDSGLHLLKLENPKKHFCIIKISGDRLTICTNSHDYPTKFVAPAGSRNVLEVFRRSKSDCFKLQGTWDLVEGDPLKLFDAKPDPDSPKPPGFKVDTLLFNGTWFELSADRDREDPIRGGQGDFTLDESRMPKDIDLDPNYNDEKLLGIYELDMEKRRLKLCLGKVRPTKFENHPGANLFIFKLNKTLLQCFSH